MQAYLINLDRSPERFHFFEKQASAAGIEFERISAVDGRQLSSAELAAAVAAKFEFQPINAGEIGLFMSHKRAWEKLVASGAPHATVFEDDVVLSPSIRSDFAAIDAGKPEFDVIKLESTLRKVVCLRKSILLTHESVLQRLHTWHGGTAGYVISSSCAQLLLKLKEQLADPIDQVMFNPISRISLQLNIQQLNPAACIQKDILEKEKSAAFGTTIDRNVTGGRIFRHGPLIDIRRLLKKQTERLRRNRLARRPENIEAVIPFHQQIGRASCRERG